MSKFKIFIQGIIDVSPLMIPVVPFGLIFGVLAIIILAVEIIMIIAKIGINVLVGMLAHGGVQQKLAMLIIKGIGAIGEFGSLIKSSNKALKKYTKMALRIIAAILSAVLLIQPILDFVQQR